MKMIDGLEFWSVDEVIECLSLGTDRDKVTSALLTAMPDAYGTRPERETPPEPDADPQFKLKRIWKKLEPEVQAAINAAAAKEGL